MAGHPQRAPPSASRVRSLAEELGTDLVSPSRYAGLMEVALRGPADPQVFTLECHLGDPANVDYVVQLERETARLLGHEAELWPETLRPFVDAWLEPDSPLAAVAFAEVEYDQPGRDSQLTAWGGVGTQPRWERGIRQAWEYQRADGGSEARLALADRVFALLTPAAAASSRDAYLRCFDALPSWGFITHVGSLWSRRASAGGLRLIVSLPRTAVPSYLDAIGFPARPTLLRRLDRVHPYLERVDFDLTLLVEGWGTTMGIYAGGVRPRSASSSIRGWLRTARELSGHSEEELAPIRSWLGRVDGRVDRGLTFKFSWTGDGPPTAKAYFTWTDPAQL